MTKEELFSYYLGKVLRYQERFYDWLDDFSEAVFKDNRLSFSKGSYDCEVIGHFSSDCVWHWENGRVSDYAKAEGKKLGLEAFMAPKVSLAEESECYQLMAIAVGIYPEDICYYLYETGEESLVLAVFGLPKEIFLTKDDDLSLVQAMLECLNTYDARHKPFVEGYLAWHGLSFQTEAGKITAPLREHRLEVGFSSAGDIVSIDLDKKEA